MSLPFLLLICSFAIVAGYVRWSAGLSPACETITDVQLPGFTYLLHTAMSIRFLIILLVVSGLISCSADTQSLVEPVRLNQIGYYPTAPKMAIVAGESANEFYVVTSDLADTVFTGTMGAPEVWGPSGESVRKADFSQLQDTGTFVVVVPGLGSSHPFEIKPEVHQAIARASIKGFYFQRMSVPLEEEYAGPWARPAGHPDTTVLVHASAADEVRPEGTILSAPRGWYDAGDYNKYIVNSGITTGTLLMLQEHFPDYFSRFGLNIPESTNRLPDLLNETLWNVRWMLAMQDPNDGGVYHKLTAASFEGMVMPHQATSPRYVVQKSTAAALDFAAVMALAARIIDDFEEELPGLADSCLTAARAAWNWAIEHPDVLYRQNEMNEKYDPDVTTGAYGDGNVADEFTWAATELFITTGDQEFLLQHNPLTRTDKLTTPSWPDVGSMPYISLAHHAGQVSGVIDTEEVKRRINELADAYLADQSQSAYGVVMGGSERDFVWGSNAVAANQGVMLIQAYRLTGDDRYLHAALSNLDYLLGRNATGYSFVTGYGDKTPKYPHHRQSEADQVAEPVPGLLAGGPNPGRQDQGGCPSYPSMEPAKAYLDHVCSYASNEIAINWNAPLAYLAGAIEAIFSSNVSP